jgi:hypothetical protein
LPPAPAQKSTTVSPRRAPTTSASSWLPSSWTSTMPLSTASPFCSEGLPSTRRPSGECGVGTATTPSTASLLDRLRAIGLQRVDAQVERRAGVVRFDPAPELVAEPSLQRLGKPRRQVVAERLGQRTDVDRAAALEPRTLVPGECQLEDALVAAPGEDREAALERPRARRREMAMQGELAQQREEGLGERVAVACAERALLAEEIGGDTVGGMLEAQHATHELGLCSEQGRRVHGRPLS